MHLSPTAVKRKKISIWILHGSSGITFELNPMKLAACAAVLCLALSCVAVFIGRTVLSSTKAHEPQVTELAAANLLERYLSSRVSHEGPAGRLQQTHIKPVAEAPLYAGLQAHEALQGDRPETQVLDAKIKMLVDEFVRVRSYEKQLQSRAGLLENILNNILDLDENYFGGGLPGADGLEEDTSSPRGDSLGIGGGEEPFSPLLQSDAEAVLREKGSPPSRPKTLAELDARIERLHTLPLGTPVAGIKSSKFGPRFSPFSKRYHLHSGLDIAVDRESSVASTADGVVSVAGEKGAYGRMVIIDHGNGLETVYGHLSRIAVKEGQKVCRSQLVGFVGSTGRSTGPHLHYEVRVDGRAKDPEPFVKLASMLRAFSADS